MRRGLVLLAALGAAACGSSVAGPSRPGLAQVQLRGTSGQVFTGSVVPGQLLVAQVLDSAGDVVSNAMLSLAAPPGWTVRGDTLVAPTREALGTVTVTATAADPSSASSALSLGSVFNLDSLGLVFDTVRCDSALYYANDSGAVRLADSLAIALTVDSVWNYDPRFPAPDIFSGDWHPTIWLHGSQTVWDSTGAHAVTLLGYSTAPGVVMYGLGIQRPDTIWTPADSVYYTSGGTNNRVVYSEPSVVDTSLGVPRWRASSSFFCGYIALGPKYAGILQRDSTFWITATRLP